MSKHTPGPWCAVNENEIHDRKAEFDDDGAVVGDRPNLIAKAEYHPGGWTTEAGYEIMKANARLIAAAPEMLTALELAMRALNTAPRIRIGETDSYKIAATVSAVIKKAKGE